MAAPVGAGEPPLFRALLFVETAGFHHPSIADGILMIHALAADNGFAVDVAETSEVFTPAILDDYRVVVSLSTSGDVFAEAEQTAFQAWVEAGGGWVGIHAAANCEHDWPWYGELLGGGAWFDSHPEIQEAEVRVEDFSHPSTRSWPPVFDFTEEWYNFQANPRPVVSVLLTLDESTYDPGPGAMGEDHPIAWYHPQGAGRAFYTAFGHRPETYADPRFADHVLGGILWASGYLVFSDGFERGDTSAWTVVSD
ncbi:MAG: ThuA domain-containing protein [Thermoanaerobaculia bacterium]